MRSFKLLKTPIVCISAGRLVPTCADVRVGVSTTVSEAPPTEVACTPRTLERKTALKVQEGMAISGTLQCQDLIDDVLA